MRVRVLVCCAAVCFGGAVGRATLVEYSFDDGGVFANPGETVGAPGLIHGAWTDRDANGVTDYQGNPSSGRAIADNGWSGTGNAFLWSIAVDPGSVLSLTSFEFDDQASGSGEEAEESGER